MAAASAYIIMNRWRRHLCSAADIVRHTLAYENEIIIICIILLSRTLDYILY